MNWKSVSAIPGVVITPMTKHEDSRGWLVEIWRGDEALHVPRMAYASCTKPGVVRGPHAHRDQTDMFAFLGFQPWNLRLWDSRPSFPSYGTCVTMRIVNPTIVTVPPGIVHAYANAGSELALVVNLPDRLYAGAGKHEPVDEIRYEGNPMFHVEQLAAWMPGDDANETHP